MCAKAAVPGPYATRVAQCSLMHGQQLNKQSRRHETGTDRVLLCRRVSGRGTASRRTAPQRPRRDDGLAGCDVGMMGARGVLFRSGIQPRVLCARRTTKSGRQKFDERQLCAIKSGHSSTWLKWPRKSRRFAANWGMAARRSHCPRRFHETSASHCPDAGQ